MCIIVEIVLNSCCFSYNASFSLGLPWLVHRLRSLIMHYVSHSWCSFYSSWSRIKIGNVDIKFAASLHIDYPMFELRNASAERVHWWLRRSSVHCWRRHDLYALLGRHSCIFFLGFELVLQFAIRRRTKKQVNKKKIALLFCSCDVLPLFPTVWQPYVHGLFV